MMLDEIARRVIVPDTGFDLNAKLEAVWLRAVRAAEAIALQPLERCDDRDREAAFLLGAPHLGVGVERREARVGEILPQVAELGRLAKVQGIYKNLRKVGPSSAQRVLIAYANLLCRNKQIPTVKAVQDEIRRDGKARGERYMVPEHSGVRFILERAGLPKISPGWPKKKQQ
jgi:hypothetical protein